jgi:hypothetical protein
VAAPGGDAICGLGLADAFERSADVEGRGWASKTLVRFGGKIFFGETMAVPGVIGTAEAFGNCGHAALAAVGE